MRGFAGIGLHCPQDNHNVGAALRAAGVFGAAFVCYSGKRKYSIASTDTMKAARHLPLFHVEDLHDAVPYDCIPVAVERTIGARSLVNFAHPERAFYIFGPESGSVPTSVLSWCVHTIVIPSNGPLNLAACVNVILYDRSAKSPALCA